MADQEISDTEILRSSAQEREGARFDITIRQASRLFAELGAPRSPRSVQGFCKDGHIDAIRVKGPTGDRYFINRESIERYATELKQIEDVAKIGVDIESAQLHEPARDSAQPRAKSVPIQVSDDVGHEDREQELEGTITKLREENLNLRIDNRGKESFINQIVLDRNRLLEAVREISYKLGAAESRVQQLEAPKEEVRISAQEHEPARKDDPGGSPAVIPVAVMHETRQEIALPGTDPKPEGASSLPGEPSKRSVWQKIFG